MTSKVGQVKDLSLFDYGDNELKLCASHQKKAQAAIVATINKLFDTNKTFHALFETVLTKSKNAPLTLRVTHEALSIAQPGHKVATLEFADLAKTDDSVDIINKSQDLLQKIDGIYQRCINEHHADTTTRPLHRSRVAPLADSPRTSRSSGSRRASSASASTADSEAEETRSRRSGGSSPLSSRSTSPVARPKAAERKKVHRDAGTDAPDSTALTSSKKTAANAHAATMTDDCPTSRRHTTKGSVGAKPSRPRFYVRRADASLYPKKPKTSSTTTALADVKAELDATKLALAEAKRKEEAIQAFLAGIHASHPKIPNETLSEYLNIARLLESSVTDELPPACQEAFRTLNFSPKHSIFRNMYLMLHKKATLAEPADERDRWEIGQKFFFEKGYLGTSLTTEELNQARANAIRYFVMNEIAKEFYLSIIDGTVPNEPAADLIALYDQLPESMKNKIEGQLWQIKGADKSARSNYGHLAFHGLEGITNADRAQAIREFVEESILKN